jgi:ATP synthase protein I
MSAAAPAAARCLMAGDRGPVRQGQEDEGQQDKGGTGRGQDENAGWTLFSYLIAGMAVYGAIGWVVGRWTYSELYFPLGMLVGLALAIVLIIYRYGRS